MLNKALPSLGSLFFVPASFLYGATLVARDEMPTWPPSPAWAITLMPYVSLTYSSVYYEFFGTFEKRLNRALRGRTQVAEEPPAAPQPQAGEPAERLPDDEEEGVGAALFRLGNAVLNLFGGEDEVVLEAEVRLGAHEEEQLAEELQEMIEDDPEAIVMIEEALEEAANEQAEHVAQHQEEEGDDAAPAPVIRIQRNEDRPAAQDEPAQDPPAEENRPNTTLTDIVNGTVTALLFPAISFGVGELLRLGLPRGWVTRAVESGARRSPNGLLQERWGRSLVGGCLFVVLKDALNLYTKYRRVEVRKHRHVKNVERRRGGQGGTAAPS
ncbi:putative ring finger domain-containing protein [Phaeoacremonium minimum UCRPA7]|uniref:Putative ring finger domain-containing protein n=1 Tax=Phaeoacremonium minimum (strain UCR-PA7) TaxID=1286976 RepID=R8BE06_PHAM7|nr:putative ring finger domain-containing protein [Phaeoacremonium minimum UCRPA7]EON97539.1 putative ring finger domain-containing protein [Phaeoacremonium minimum UCRPA7]